MVPLRTGLALGSRFLSTYFSVGVTRRRRRFAPFAATLIATPIAPLVAAAAAILLIAAATVVGGPLPRRRVGLATAATLAFGLSLIVATGPESESEVVTCVSARPCWGESPGSKSEFVLLGLFRHQHSLNSRVGNHPQDGDRQSDRKGSLAGPETDVDGSRA